MRSFEIESAAEARRDRTPVNCRPLRILLVEDVPANQHLILSLLRNCGYEVDLAADGREAVEKTRQRKYDVALMDLQMPNMNGLEATALIRAFPQGGSLPIIAITTQSERHEQEDCFAVGMNAFVAKPINCAELLKSIDNVLSRAAIA